MLPGDGGEGCDRITEQWLSQRNGAKVLFSRVHDPRGRMEKNVLIRKQDDRLAPKVGLTMLARGETACM